MVGLPRTTYREPPLREPQGRELVEPAGRTTERPVHKHVVRGLLAMDHNSASLTEVARSFGRDVSPDPTKKLKYTRPWNKCHKSFSHRGDGSVTSLTVSFGLHGANHSSTWSGAQYRVTLISFVLNL